MFEKMGGRKLTLGLLMLSIGLTIGYIRGDIPPNVLSLMEFIFASFVAGNSVGTIAGVVQGKRDEEVSTEVIAPIKEEIDLQPIITALEEIKQADESLAVSISSVQQALSFIIRKYQIDKIPDPQ